VPVQLALKLIVIKEAKKPTKIGLYTFIPRNANEEIEINFLEEE
jgi:hypothetical protein